MTRSTTAEQPGRPTRSLKERQREERAALILQAAHDVFVEKGYHDASIDEIAARVGISKGTVYLHFASKEELLEALVEQQIVELLATIDRITAEAMTVRARLEQILELTYGGLRDKHGQVPLELTYSLGLSRSMIEQRAGLQAHIAHVTERIAALLEEGKRTGELDPTLPTPIMVATFISLLSPRGYEQLLTSGQVSPAELVTAVSQVLFRGILAPSS